MLSNPLRALGILLRSAATDTYGADHLVVGSAGADLHCATPQPYFVPVSPKMSLSTHSSGVSPGASTVRSIPLTRILPDRDADQ
jgi:hypothetical protein